MKTPNPTAAPAGKQDATGAPAVELVPLRFKLQSILVPIDFSWPSKKALQYAVPFAEQFGAKITLLYVSEPMIYAAELGFAAIQSENDDVTRTVKENLRALAEQSMPEGMLDHAVVRFGSPFNEITDAAKTLKTDLIIIATHGYTGLKHALMGSNAERVVRHAPCPVLVVREEEHEFV